METYSIFKMTTVNLQKVDIAIQQLPSCPSILVFQYDFAQFIQAVRLSRRFTLVFRSYS
jgi:hypothetical protein